MTKMQFYIFPHKNYYKFLFTTIMFIELLQQATVLGIHAMINTL